MRRRVRAATRRRARAAIAVVALLALAAPSAAPGDARPVVGLSATVDAAGTTPRREARAIAAAGVAWVRDDVEWARVEPRPGAYDWRIPDEIVEGAARAGLRLLPIVDDTPCWAAPAGTPPDQCRESVPAAADAYAAFVAAVVARYGPDGAFWRAHTDLDPLLAPATFELLNEPYHGRPEPGRYAELVRTAVRAGRDANPETRWLAAATTSATGPDGAPIDWPAAMTRAVPDLARWVDGLAIHAYPADLPPVAVTEFVRAVRGAYAAHGVDRPAWVTELGIAACADPPSSERCVSGATRTRRETVKAARLGAAIRGLRAEPGVAAVFTYTLRSWDDPVEGTFGLLDASARPLPALAAFRRAAGPPTPGVWAWPPAPFP